jgi:hypothetical protein
MDCTFTNPLKPPGSRQTAQGLFAIFASCQRMPASRSTPTTASEYSDGGVRMMAKTAKPITGTTIGTGSWSKALDRKTPPARWKVHPRYYSPNGYWRAGASAVGSSRESRMSAFFPKRTFEPCDGYFWMSQSVRATSITDNALHYRSRLEPTPRPIPDCPARIRDLVRGSTPKPPGHP